MNTIPQTTSKQPLVLTIENGDTPLGRTCKIRLPYAVIERNLNKVLLNEARRHNIPGFRQKSKVVPPIFRKSHGQHYLNELLFRHASPSLMTSLNEQKIRIVPGVQLGSYERDGNEYVVECLFELRPEIPQPKFERLKLRKPVPDFSKAEVDKVIDRVRMQHATYSKVDRAAKANDQVMVNFEGQENHIVVEGPGVPVEISKELKGKSAGDKGHIIEDGSEPPKKLEFDVNEVQEPKLPNLDLEFARKLFPEAGSVEAFIEKVTDNLKAQAGALAYQVQINRSLDVLERATGEFELPPRLVEHYYGQRIQGIEQQAKEKGLTLDQVKIDESRLRKTVAHDVRVSLLVNEYGSTQKLDPTEEELNTALNEMAQDQQDPDVFLREIKKNRDQLERVYETVSRRKVSEKIHSLAEVEEVIMSADEIDAILRNGDPETRRIDVENKDG